MADENTCLGDLKRMVSDFVKEREWERFHNPKDLAISLSIESNELLELFQWRRVEDIDLSNVETADKLKNELADVIIYALSLANRADIDISEAVSSKIRENESRYPADEWKGRAWL